MTDTPPTATHDTFYAYLKHRGLSEKTCRDYVKTAARWTRGTDYESPEDYLRQHSGPDAKEGTVVPALAAARHWCRWMGYELTYRPQWRKSPGYTGLVMSRAEALDLLSRCQESPGRVYAHIVLETGLRGHTLETLTVPMIQRAILDGSYTLRAKRQHTVQAPLTRRAIGHLGALAALGGAAPAHDIRKAWRETRGTYNGPLDARIVRQVTLHTFRHVYASDLLERGAKITAVKDLLAHTSLASTERYLHAHNLRDAVGILDGAEDA